MILALSVVSMKVQREIPGVTSSETSTIMGYEICFFYAGHYTVDGVVKSVSQ